MYNNISKLYLLDYCIWITKKQMEALPIFMEAYDDSKYNLQPISDDDFKLLGDYKPFPGIPFTIKSDSVATIIQRYDCIAVHFRTEVNYFQVLHHLINDLLAETMHTPHDHITNQQLKRIEAGLSYLDLVLQRTKSVTQIDEAMVHPTEMCIDILNRFKSVPEPPVALFAKCFNVCTSLLPLADLEIFTRIINLSILPAVSNEFLNDYKKYAHGVGCDSGLIGTWLVNVEKKREQYDLLTAYLGFLRAYAKLQRKNFHRIEIPGIVFLLREVFPHMHSWRFHKTSEKHKTYADTMGFISDVLDSALNIKDTDRNIRKQREMLRNICVYSLLDTENGLILLRFVAVGNAYLQHTMEMESNWMLQQTHSHVLLVRLAMRILMQLLRLRHTIFARNELSSLEALIYTQPKQRDTLRIIPVVTSYMNNIFDRWLPILACRLLKRIALEFNMSLLACLDMEPDQIRLIFLQKLPDELESDSLKIAILELVEACIVKQPGITEAFFKVDAEQEKRLFGGREFDTPIAESIITYLEDYLSAVANEPQTVQHQLPSKIMNLFHSLWRQNMQNLVEGLRKRDQFWEQLCNPLFIELPPNVRAHTQLLNIISIEIFCTAHQPNEQLKNVLSRFFDAKYFDKWLTCVFDLPKVPVNTDDSSGLCFPNDLENEEMPEWLCRLQSFKSFLILILRKQPQYINIPQAQLKKLAEKTLKVLVERIQYVEDLRPFILLTELYLFELLAFRHSYTETPAEDRTMLSELIELLGRMVSCYADMHVRAKEALLGLMIKCADLLTGELLDDSNMALSFLHSVVSVICIELQSLDICVKTESSSKINAGSAGSKKLTDSFSKNTLVLTFNLLKTVATIFHNDGPGNWDLPFIINKVFQRLLSCAGNILQIANKQQLSVELLEVLIVFARGNCSVEFLHCDVGDYLSLKLLPPKELLQPDLATTVVAAEVWTTQKWWPIYARGIEFMTTLLQKHGNHFLKETLQFVGIHECYLTDSLLLGKQSMEPIAVSLIKSAITLLAELVNYETQWRLEHKQSMFVLMRSVQALMGYSISMFQQPRNLKALVLGQESQFNILHDTAERVEQMENVIAAFNNLSEIIVLCAKCLLRFSPDLLDLLCAPEFLYSQWELIFEMNFGAPKLEESDVRLTFGTVLSVVSVYTKVLNLQNYAFNEIPLNELPDNADIADNADNAYSTTVIHRGRSSSQQKQQRTFSKSLSVASVSSAACPPNELLANLDGEICLIALEHILMLAASQSLLTLKNPHVPIREKQLIRREISSELLSFHEFVRKKVLVVDPREHKDLWHRRKYGQVYMHMLRQYDNNDDNDDNNNDDEQSTTSKAARNLNVTSRSSDTNRRHSTDLRINVVRRQHLQHQRQHQPSQLPFQISEAISPISGNRTSDVKPSMTAAVSSTPLLMHPPARRPGVYEPHGEDCAKRVTFHFPNQQQRTSTDEPDVTQHFVNDEDEDNDTDAHYPPKEPTFTPLSFVQIVEEDFLHLMSNLFLTICQSDQ